MEDRKEIYTFMPVYKPADRSSLAEHKETINLFNTEIFFMSLAACNKFLEAALNFGSLWNDVLSAYIECKKKGLTRISIEYAAIKIETFYIPITFYNESKTRKTSYHFLIRNPQAAMLTDEPPSRDRVQSRPEGPALQKMPQPQISQTTRQFVPTKATLEVIFTDLHMKTRDFKFSEIALIKC